MKRLLDPAPSLFGNPVVGAYGLHEEDPREDLRERAETMARGFGFGEKKSKELAEQVVTLAEDMEGREVAPPIKWDPPDTSLLEDDDDPEPPTTAERFAEFHAKNPNVYAELRRLALKLRSKGVASYSIKGLYEVVRFNGLLEDVNATVPSAGIKLSNSFTPFYARLLMERNPELEGFFVTRSSEADL